MSRGCLHTIGRSAAPLVVFFSTVGCAATTALPPFAAGFDCPRITRDWHIIDPVGNIHRGIDIADDIGTPVIAAADGEVTFTGLDRSVSGGNTVTVNHGIDEKGRRIRTTYHHLETIVVTKGQRVIRGQQIGTLGRSGLGSWYEPHLHFSVFDTTARTWHDLNPHDFWLRHPGEDKVDRIVIPPFLEGAQYPPTPIRFTYPVPCIRTGRP
jgi:murein DD-endopeptidase MepM/ murein hydrolase activator NlpD